MASWPWLHNNKQIRSTYSLTRHMLYVNLYISTGCLIFLLVFLSTFIIIEYNVSHLSELNEVIQISNIDHDFLLYSFVYY